RPRLPPFPTRRSSDLRLVRPAWTSHSRMRWASAATTAAYFSDESSELRRRAEGRAVRGTALLAGGRLVRTARGRDAREVVRAARSEEHTSELQSRVDL